MPRSATLFILLMGFFPVAFAAEPPKIVQAPQEATCEIWVEVASTIKVQFKQYLLNRSYRALWDLLDEDKDGVFQTRNGNGPWKN